MKSYYQLDLPALPEPWVWEEGEDGDPVAVLRVPRWVVRVHEAVARKYTDKLAITNRHIRIRDIDAMTPPPIGIPFPVFKAVNRALRDWYEVPDEWVSVPIKQYECEDCGFVDDCDECGVPKELTPIVCPGCSRTGCVECIPDDEPCSTCEEEGDG